jgi:Cu-Zn family superoxide dismutase
MKTSATSAVALAAVTLLAGCGGGGGSDKVASDDVLVASDPANKAFEGSFTNLKTAPKDLDAVIGLTDLVVGHGKSRITITAAGLDNKGQYFGWLQADSCSTTDPGGAHFKFDPNGNDQPPNSVRFEITFEVDRHGAKQNGITADLTVPGDASAAKSVVLYMRKSPKETLAETNPPKLACANLAPATS